MDMNPIHLVKKAMGIPSRIGALEYEAEILRERINELEQKNIYLKNSSLPKTKYPLEIAKLYFQRTGEYLHLNDPKTFNEKIQWFKLYGVTPEITRLADKYKVREFVAEKIGEEYLVPLLGVWNLPTEIDFSRLPESFVLKANHGSGYNFIVRDKSTLNQNELIRMAWKWLDEDFEYRTFEMQYHGIERRLIAEKYLENAGEDLYDYKVWCFNGRAKYIQFLSQRKTGLKMDFFDRDWKHQTFIYDHPNCGQDIPKPNNLDELIEIAETLAAGFPHVRVDFYRMNDGTLYFGEMTFTSASGFQKWDPPEMDAKIGSLFSYL